MGLAVRLFHRGRDFRVGLLMDDGLNEVRLKRGSGDVEGKPVLKRQVQSHAMHIIVEGAVETSGQFRVVALHAIQEGDFVSGKRRFQNMTTSQPQINQSCTRIERFWE